ncbi:7-dehydrocholesterol reductase-like protein [Parasponia andersonii]|uniref:7-dehydrocholesterol reductase-like protein n=1 Tax=Parasponia andersonii TaxID=3476 RepID=A0A2P5DIC5_PARAD|nr:7-dehydrocholesterol reductase-like protein [Parasponia andersonii]
MSEYDENIVVGKLRLKGKALEVKGGSGGIKKKKKHRKHYHHLSHQLNGFGLLSKDGDSSVPQKDQLGCLNDADKDCGNDYLTPAERRYLQQWEERDRRRLEKMASKSHRDRIQKFSRYLANLTEHYDIPKVGPG